MLPERKNCRKHYKILRDNMTQEQVITKSRVICMKVLACDEYKNAKTIMAYYPLGKEVNCISIIRQALEDGKQVVLPRTESDCHMDFYVIKCLEDVEEGHFHVMEPNTACEKFLPAQEADVANEHILALVPGIAFDRIGNRYGYGRGYYDRYFARFPHLKRMALSYSKQLANEPLECLETDIKMHVIVNEDEIIRMDEV